MTVRTSIVSVVMPHFHSLRVRTLQHGFAILPQNDEYFEVARDQ